MLFIYFIQLVSDIICSLFSPVNASRIHSAHPILIYLSRPLNFISLDYQVKLYLYLVIFSRVIYSSHWTGTRPFLKFATSSFPFIAIKVHSRHSYGSRWPEPEYRYYAIMLLFLLFTCLVIYLTMTIRKCFSLGWVPSNLDWHLCLIPLKFLLQIKVSVIILLAIPERFQ